MGRKGQASWNKGHTKKTDPRLAEYGKKISKTRREKKIRPWNINKTKETDPRVAKYVAAHVGKPSGSLGKTWTWSEESRSNASKRTMGRPSWNKDFTKYTHPSLMKTSNTLRIYAVNKRGSFPKTNTSIEVILQNGLKSHKITFETDKPLLNITRADIYILPNICVFADGDHWHNYPVGREIDRRQTKTLVENGFVVLRFWERDIHKDPEGCIQKILDEIDKNGGRRPCSDESESFTEPN